MFISKKLDYEMIFLTFKTTFIESECNPRSL